MKTDLKGKAVMVENCIKS